MSDFDRNVAAFPGARAGTSAAVDAGLRAHMIRVYNYMAGGVALTGFVAYFTNLQFGQALYGSPLMYVLIFAPLALVFFLSWRIESLSVSTARALFFVYAALLGASLSIIFAVYTDASITRVFFISAAARDGADAVLGVFGVDGDFAVFDLPRLHAYLDRAGVLHHRRLVRRAQPVRLHHEA